MDRAAVCEHDRDRGERDLPPRRGPRRINDPEPGRYEKARGRERHTTHQARDASGEQPLARERRRGDHDERRDGRGSKGHRGAGDPADEVAETHDVEAVGAGRDAADRDRLNHLLVRRDAWSDQIRPQQRQR